MGWKIDLDLVTVVSLPENLWVALRFGPFSPSLLGRNGPLRQYTMRSDRRRTLLPFGRGRAGEEFFQSSDGPRVFSRQDGIRGSRSLSRDE